MQQEFGPEICQTYVISMSHDVSDLLAVLLLAKEAGLYDPATGISSFQVVPLFETVEDLKKAPEVMEKIFDLPLYRALLSRRIRAGTSGKKRRESQKPNPNSQIARGDAGLFGQQ
jgi:Phosphoenolpyruvate carboxylase